MNAACASEWHMAIIIIERMERERIASNGFVQVKSGKECDEGKKKWCVSIAMDNVCFLLLRVV